MDVDFLLLDFGLFAIRLESHSDSLHSDEVALLVAVGLGLWHHIVKSSSSFSNNLELLLADEAVPIDILA